MFVFTVHLSQYHTKPFGTLDLKKKIVSDYIGKYRRVSFSHTSSPIHLLNIYKGFCHSTPHRIIAVINNSRRVLHVFASCLTLSTSFYTLHVKLSMHEILATAVKFYKIFPWNIENLNAAGKTQFLQIFLFSL